MDYAVAHSIDPENIAERFEQVCADLGLMLLSRGTLRKYPGCVHWHFKKVGSTGTLEATLWRGNLWLHVRSNRQGDWTSEAVGSILERMASEEK